MLQQPSPCINTGSREVMQCLAQLQGTLTVCPNPFGVPRVWCQGTMSHMAPEALLRGHISKKADVYSYGITLWELFTGCHAYHGESVHRNTYA